MLRSLGQGSVTDVDADCRVDGQRRVVDDTALAGIAYWADVDIGQVPAIVRAALRGDTGPLIAAAGALSHFTGSPVPGVAQDVALAFAIEANDFPTLWNRRAPTPVRERQFAARRARLDQRAFRPFTEPAWTSAITDRGNVAIRWPDRHGPVQRASGPLPDVPVLVTSGDLDANTRPQGAAKPPGSSRMRSSSRSRTARTGPNWNRVAASSPSSSTSSATNASATEAASQTSHPSP